MNRCATTSSFREMNEVILQFSFSDCVFSMSSLKTNQNKIKSNLATRFWRGLCGLYREQAKTQQLGLDVIHQRGQGAFTDLLNTIRACLLSDLTFCIQIKFRESRGAGFNSPEGRYSGVKTVVLNVLSFFSLAVFKPPK